MKKFEVRVYLSPFMDNFHDSSVKGYCSKCGIEISELSSSETHRIRQEETRDLLDCFSDTTFKRYQELNYEERCNILRDALKNKETSIENTIKDRFEPASIERGNYLIDISYFEEFVNLFGETYAIDWLKISKCEDIKWTTEVIDKCKSVLDWAALHQNPGASFLFIDFTFLKKFEFYINWITVAHNQNIRWDIEHIKLLQHKLLYKRFEVSCIGKLVENLHGLGSNPHLNKDIILEFIEQWDWYELSSNPVIIECDIFAHPIANHIDIFGLSKNPALSIEILRHIKEFYSCPDISKFPIINEGFWKDAFANANIHWDEHNILEFIEILNEFQNWEAISKKICDKALILKYGNKLDYINLTLNSTSNKDIIWDSELIDVLIETYKGKRFVKYSSQWGYKSYNMDRAGFPGILSYIKITKDAIINNKDFWRNTYQDHFIATAIKAENETYVDELWNCLKENKNIIWDDDLNEAYYNQKYKKGDLIKIVSTGISGQVVATKARHLSFKSDTGYIYKVYPRNEYIVCLKRNSCNEEYTFNGIVDINEDDIQSN